jgi:hypothetical protein
MASPFQQGARGASYAPYASLTQNAFGVPMYGGQMIQGTNVLGLLQAAFPDMQIPQSYGGRLQNMTLESLQDANKARQAYAAYNPQYGLETYFDDPAQRINLIMRDFNDARSSHVDRWIADENYRKYWQDQGYTNPYQSFGLQNWLGMVDYGDAEKAFSWLPGLGQQTVPTPSPVPQQTEPKVLLQMPASIAFKLTPKAAQDLVQAVNEAGGAANMLAALGNPSQDSVSQIGPLIMAEYNIDLPTLRTILYQLAAMGY